MKKIVLINNDYSIELFPIIISKLMMFKSEKWKEIRDNLIEKYNNKPSEIILSMLLMMKIYKKYESIIDKLKYLKSIVYGNCVVIFH